MSTAPIRPDRLWQMPPGHRSGQPEGPDQARKVIRADGVEMAAVADGRHFYFAFIKKSAPA
jgi:hypothetical protein